MTREETISMAVSAAIRKRQLFIINMGFPVTSVQVHDGHGGRKVFPWGKRMMPLIFDETVQFIRREFQNILAAT